MALLKTLRARRCRRRGHDWFPNLVAREFIPTADLCFRCRARRTLLPWGRCITGHPIADHYDPRGNLIAVAGCAGPA